MAFEIKNNLLVKYIGIGSDERVVIPDNITHIDRFAFHNCSGIINIELPESVVSIGDGAFFWM